MQGKVKVKPDISAVPAVYVGIDVCKERLDVHIHPTGDTFAVANDPGGWRSLKRKLARHTVERVVMEATSKFHRAAHRSLAASGYTVAIVNPLRARLYAEAIGRLAKTDGVDAKMLAMMACQIAPDATEPASLTLETLKEMAHARRKLVDQKTATMLQRGSTACNIVRAALESVIKAQKAAIRRIEARIVETIKADASLERRYAILTSIPGIGPVVASTLIATMTELGAISDKQASALAGLAPFADDSGPRTGKRKIRGGRSAARQVLYQAALVASRHNPPLKTVYLRLTTAGKAKKVALIALARKILIMANALVQQNRTWEPRKA